MATQNRTKFEFEGFTEVSENLMKLSTENKHTADAIRDAVTQVVAEARSEIADKAKSIAENGDPRQSYRAVRRNVYKKIFGGYVSILNKKKGQAAPVEYNKHRTLQPGQRGGNRRKVSERTKQLDNYFGSDRGFILRFLNTGTKKRTTRYGDRGSITAQNWFTREGFPSMQKAAENLSKMIDEEIAKQFAS